MSNKRKVPDDNEGGVLPGSRPPVGTESGGLQKGHKIFLYVLAAALALAALSKIF